MTAAKLIRSELTKQSYRWVIGYLMEWNNQSRQFNLGTEEGMLNFRNYADRIHTTVYRYIRGQKTLDGSCSDLECTAAHEADQLFACVDDIFCNQGD